MFWACHKTMRYHYFLLMSSSYGECLGWLWALDTLRNATIPKRNRFLSSIVCL